MGMCVTGRREALPSSQLSALGLHLSLDPIASLTLNVLDREGKSSNWITIIENSHEKK